MEGVSHRNSAHRRLRFATVHFVPARHQQTDATNELTSKNQKHLMQKPPSSCGTVGNTSAVSPVRNTRRINDLNMAKVPIFEDLFEQRVLVQRSSMVQDQLLIQLSALLIANENKGTTMNGTNATNDMLTDVFHSCHS